MLSALRHISHIDEVDRIGALASWREKNWRALTQLASPQARDPEVINLAGVLYWANHVEER